MAEFCDTTSHSPVIRKHILGIEHAIEDRKREEGVELNSCAKIYVNIGTDYLSLITGSQCGTR